jgi:hypothetical protein
LWGPEPELATLVNRLQGIDGIEVQEMVFRD